MDKLIVEGPATLSGNVEISRAKNAYLPIITAVLLSDKPVHLKNIPALRDIRTIKKLLSQLGVVITEQGNITTFDASNLTSYEATYELVKTMRASILVLGPLLARFKQGKVSLPGGCAIGARPIDIHLTNFEKMGAIIQLESGYVEASTTGLQGARLVLSFPSVGATENIMMAAVFAEGVTVIENAAMEPEIDDLAHFLNAMGAKIEGIGGNSLKVTGVPVGSLKEVEYEAIADRIEAATYLMAGLITKSEITITRMQPKHLDSVISNLEEMGAKLEIGDTWIKTLPSTLSGVTVDTAPYPGFPTDVQAQLIALATCANTPSIICETIFENRFMHVPELKRLGANIIVKGNTAVIDANNDLKAAPVMCSDLRASAALVLAALAANGKTEIHRVYHLDRGYEKLDQKLTALGAKITRVSEED